MKRAVLWSLKPTTQCLAIWQIKLRQHVSDMELYPVTADARTRGNLAIRHPVLNSMRDSPFSRRKNIIVGPASSALLTCHRGILAPSRENFPPPARHEPVPIANDR